MQIVVHYKVILGWICAAVLLKHALVKCLLLETSQLFTCMDKHAHVCLNVEPTLMVIHDTKMITQKTVETMSQWKGNSTEVNKKKFATESLRLR